MDSRPSAVEPNQTYQSTAPWSRVGTIPSTNGQSTPRTPGASTSTSNGFSESVPTSTYPPTLDLLPLLFSQHQAQLLQYNKLISPGRGGGGGLQPTCLPGVAPVPSIQAAPRSRSRSSSLKVSNKDGHSYKQSPAAQSCHGIRSTKNTERQDCEGMTMGKDSDTPGKDKSSSNKDKETPTKTKETPPKMPLKPQPDLAHPLPSRPAQRVAQAHQHSNGSSAQSSSVPNTPQQRARNFSFESRDPSPNATQNHSPRSAYSEPNGGVASQGARSKKPCPFETASAQFRRRMPYSLGSERLEKIDLAKVKSKLSEDEERKLSTDMREVYDRLLPSPEIEQNREKLVQKLEKMFNDEWPGHDIRVHLFGSSGNLLCSDDSDVDICITTDWKPMEGVCIIADLLHRRGMEKVVCISKAKVPIVKIWDPELKLACDMNVNNTQALENTRMVRTYVEIDERVRPLAMIVKHWTRRRVVNDAAFGYTLSSYTWICMIIAFLQLRDPPVLPALHQCAEKSLKTDGQPSEFADDLSQLRGSGKNNKSTIGELLFQFFRFYAHEFDYEKMVLSVHLGRTILKEATKWERTANKDLCVEEPFNRERNLGNTLDEFSFRGLHLELRRAFDLLCEAKFDECCEQFQFPREEPSEPKVFIKPTSRPAIIRSSSQQHAGRGGRNGGGRGNKFRNGNSNRRASSSNAYEQAQSNVGHAFGAAMPHPAMYQTLSPNGEIQWAPYPFATSEMALSHALLTQQERFNWYLQAQQAHILSQHAQRLHAGSAQQAERSRTNSFDQAPPLTAPARDYSFQYPPHHQAMLYSTWQSGFGTYPSSPSTSTAPPHEFRRSLHRSSAAHEHGSSSSGGTIRSQSQPASRSSTATAVPAPGYAPTSQAFAGSGTLPSRHPQLSPFPAFVSPDDSTASDADESSNRTFPDSPPEEDSAGYLGYFVADSSVAPLNSNVNVPILNDIGMGASRSHRLSTEGPQSVLDRRLLRTSRSPSPHGHGRVVAAGVNPVPLASSTPFAQSNIRSATKEGSPLVVNGSLIPTAHGSSNWPPSQSTDDVAYDNPLHISQGKAAVSADIKTTGSDRPLVVNGSTTHSPVLASTIAALPSFGQRIATSSNTSNGTYANAFGDLSHGSKWQRPPPRNQQAAGIAPLDLAISNPMYAEVQNLSPVYENRTPSPTIFRERGIPSHGVVPSESSRQENGMRTFQKPSDRNGMNKDSMVVSHNSSRVNGQGPRDNGSLRGSRAESDSGGGWQKPKGRKKAAGETRISSKGPSQSEQPPKNGLERKGG